MAKFNLHYN